MRQHFPSQFNQLVAGDLCDVWPGIVVSETNFVTIRALDGELDVKTIKLSAVIGCVDDGVGWDQLEQDHTFGVPPD